MNTIKLSNRMETIFMNSENTSDPHRLLLSLSDKINLKRQDKYVALSNLSIYYTWKSIKRLLYIYLTKTWCTVIDVQLQLCSYWYTVTRYLSIVIYVNKIESRITSKITIIYHLDI